MCMCVCSTHARARTYTCTHNTHVRTHRLPLPLLARLARLPLLLQDAPADGPRLHRVVAVRCHGVLPQVCAAQDRRRAGGKQMLVHALQVRHVSVLRVLRDARRANALFVRA